MQQLYSKPLLSSISHFAYLRPYKFEQITETEPVLRLWLLPVKIIFFRFIVKRFFSLIKTWSRESRLSSTQLVITLHLHRLRI